jgi:hypothetical protein
VPPFKDPLEINGGDYEQATPPGERPLWRTWRNSCRKASFFSAAAHAKYTTIKLLYSCVRKSIVAYFEPLLF